MESLIENFLSHTFFMQQNTSYTSQVTIAPSYQPVFKQMVNGDLKSVYYIPRIETRSRYFQLKIEETSNDETELVTLSPFDLEAKIQPQPFVYHCLALKADILKVKNILTIAQDLIFTFGLPKSYDGKITGIPMYTKYFSFF